jgi:RNA polymerase sigma-B factor
VADAARSPADGASARAREIEEHLPLVRAIARRYADRGEPFDELVQAGSVGLIKAVDRFDPARGASLATFASALVEGEIRHHLRDQRRHSMRAVEAPLEDVSEGGAEDAERAEARMLLAGGWRMLSARERRLLELRYFEDRTQAQIAGELELSQAQVSRLLRATLDRLRTRLGQDVAAGAGRAYSGPEMAEQATQHGQPQSHSGRLLVRMPPSLHSELARAAEREGVSLNTLVTGALAGAVGWRDGRAEPAAPIVAREPGEDVPAAAGAPPDRRRTLLSVALAANFAIVAIAAILAIALLVVAFQGG